MATKVDVIQGDSLCLQFTSSNPGTTYTEARVTAWWQGAVQAVVLPAAGDTTMRLDAQTMNVLRNGGGLNEFNPIYGRVRATGEWVAIYGVASTTEVNIVKGTAASVGTGPTLINPIPAHVIGSAPEIDVEIAASSPIFIQPATAGDADGVTPDQTGDDITIVIPEGILSVPPYNKYNLDVVLSDGSSIRDTYRFALNVTDDPDLFGV